MCNNSIVLYCCCLQCVSEGRRVEESSYPHTYNPNMALVRDTILCSTLLHSQFTHCNIYMYLPEERDGEEGGGKGEEERGSVLAGVVLCLHKKTNAQYGGQLNTLHCVHVYMYTYVPVYTVHCTQVPPEAAHFS